LDGANNGGTVAGVAIQGAGAGHLERLSNGRPIRVKLRNIVEHLAFLAVVCGIAGVRILDLLVVKDYLVDGHADPSEVGGGEVREGKAALAVHAIHDIVLVGGVGKIHGEPA